MRKSNYLRRGHSLPTSSFIWNYGFWRISYYVWLPAFSAFPLTPIPTVGMICPCLLFLLSAWGGEWGLQRLAFDLVKSAYALLRKVSNTLDNQFVQNVFGPFLKVHPQDVLNKSNCKNHIPNFPHLRRVIAKQQKQAYVLVPAGGRGKSPWKAAKPEENIVRN